MEDFFKMQQERCLAAQSRIDNQEVSVVAIHPASLSEKEIQSRLQEDPNWTALSLDYLIDITANLYIIDLKTSDIGVIDMQLADVSQDNEHGQAPFAERYFDHTGRNLLEFETEYDTCPPDSLEEPGHVRFFMHYFDPTSALEFGGKQLALPNPTPMPAWLEKLMPYQPPS